MRLVISLLLFQGALAIENFTSSPAKNELVEYASSHPLRPIAVSLGGVAVPSLSASLTVGQRGPVLLQDVFLLDKLAHFNRERIPERVVHAKGAGAHGHFILDQDLSDVTKAAFLRGFGKPTKVFVRFSTVGGERGSGDTWIDPKGFAVKFYTEEGVHDLVGNNLEVFPIRDAMSFADINRSRKRNPVTNLRDPNAWWDFTSLRPEATLHTLMLFSSLGRPDTLRRADGAGVHTFKMVNATGQAVYVKFHWESMTKPYKSLTREESAFLAGANPDYNTQDLYDAISKGNFPSWRLHIQIMTLEQAARYPRNPFDPTKFWRREEFPLRPVGTMTLNRNPTNYFSEVEQAAFSPGNMVSGIEASPDKLLHARMFAYPDAQRHRLGPNFQMLPINRPGVVANNYDRDGCMNSGPNGEGSPNYFPNSFNGATVGPPEVVENPHRFFVQGADALRQEMNDISPDDDFVEARTYLERDVDANERKIIVENIADFLRKAEEFIQEKYLTNIAYPLSREFGDLLRAELTRTKDKYDHYQSY